MSAFPNRAETQEEGQCQPDGSVQCLPAKVRSMLFRGRESEAIPATQNTKTAKAIDAQKNSVHCKFEDDFPGGSRADIDSREDEIIEQH